MWWLGFLFHDIAFGLLSIFLPLYVITVGGSLVDIGLMTAIAVFLAIPFSYFWGYVSDRTRHYKICVLISFLGLAVLLYLFTLVTNVESLIILFGAMSIFHVAHEPTKNIMIAEWFSRSQWEAAFASYEGFTEIGTFAGLLLGLFMSLYGFGATNTLLLCCILNLIAFVVSLFLVTDPNLIFERSLVRIENAANFAYRGIILASKMWNGLRISKELKKENLYAFCSGLVLFSLATSIFYTPLPIFFSKELELSEDFVFAVFLLNSGGEALGYFLIRRETLRGRGKSRLCKVVMFRSILVFLLILIVLKAAYTSLMSMVILALMGFAYALFIIYTLLLSMELIPEGKSGLFNVMAGIGTACGAFIGPFLAEKAGFISVFLITGVIFLLSYVAFKIT